MTSPAPIPTHCTPGTPGLEWATGPHPFATDWCDAPGTAHDADAITPEQYERARILKACVLNPQWNVGVPVKQKVGRKPQLEHK